MNSDVYMQKVATSGLIDGLKHSLNKKHARLLENAMRRWDCEFAGKDPSDACVSVRIISVDAERLSLPAASILQRTASLTAQPQ